MKNAIKTIVFLILICIGFIVELLTAKVILSLSYLYEIDFITQFSFLQIYGLLIIFSLAEYKYKKQDADKEFMETVSDSINSIFTKTVVLLFGWGVGFIAYYIIN